MLSKKIILPCFGIALVFLTGIFAYRLRMQEKTVTVNASESSFPAQEITQESNASFVSDADSSVKEQAEEEAETTDDPAIALAKDGRGDQKNSSAPETKQSEEKGNAVASSDAQPTSKKTKQTSSAGKTDFAITDRFVDFGFSLPSKSRTIDTIILHSSYDSTSDNPYSVSGVIDIWKSYAVAPHYLIDRKGRVYRLVKDEAIAYHAGVSAVPDGRTNVNDFSVGIEILNTKTDEYTNDQYDATRKLIASLKKQYAIKYVLGHDDIAPDRKTDPWNFDWKKL